MSLTQAPIFYKAGEDPQSLNDPHAPLESDPGQSPDSHPSILVWQTDGAVDETTDSGEMAWVQILTLPLHDLRHVT